jgi:hypothetical protein
VQAPRAGARSGSIRQANHVRAHKFSRIIPICIIHLPQLDWG